MTPAPHPLFQMMNTKMSKRIIICIGLIALIGTICFSQQIQNSGFESNCVTLTVAECSWTKSWGKENCCSINTEYENNYLKIEGLDESSVGFVEQVIAIPFSDILILELEASIKTTHVKGKGAGLNIMALNQSNQLISNKDMGGFYSNRWIKKSTDWTKTKIAITLPPETEKIKIGAILYGSGEALFDDFKIRIQTLENRNPNKLSEAYISKAINMIKENSLYKDSVDYKNLERIALKIAGDARDYSDCHLAIEYLLESLRPFGDNHSFFMTIEERKLWENDPLNAEKIEYAEVRAIENVGYILVPPFHSGDEELMVKYAAHMHAEMRKIMTPQLKGWIVDLRQNSGGNQEPMIMGLAPLLDKGKIGSLLDVNGNHEHWYCRDGSYFWEDEKGISIQDPLTLERKLPIVVLTGPQTGSSGEIVVISFIGNSKTISMGQPTMGLTTGNGEFELPDGSFMYLASTKMVDRNGQIYSSQIEPDVIINSSKISEESIIDFARLWIDKNH